MTPPRPSHLPLHLRSPTTSLTSAYNNSPKLFSSTLSVTPCMLCTSSLKSVNCTPTPILSPAHVPTCDFPQDQQLPLNSIPTPAWPLLVAIAQSHLAPPPQTAQPKTNGHHRLPHSLNDPHMVRRRHNLHNYVSLILMNGSYRIAPNFHGTKTSWNTLNEFSW